MKIYVFVLIISALLFSCSHNDETWMQFRGQGAMGIAPKDAKPPTDFGPDTNVFWKIKTPKGFSSPCIYNDNLIITGINQDDKRYLVWNIDREDGSVKWQKELTVDTLENVHPASSPAAATPATDGMYIYCYFPTFGLICYDFEGNKIWDSPIEFKPVLQGSGTSPIVYNDKIILNHDNLIDPSLMVFNKSNGELVWEQKFQKYQILPSTGWSTPVVWKDQVIIHRMNGIESFGMNAGNHLWRFDIGTTGCGTPVVIDNTLYVNAWMIRGEKAFLGEVVDFRELFETNDTDKDNALSQAEFPNGIIISGRPEGHDLGIASNRLWWPMMREFDHDENNLISENEWNEFAESMQDFANHGLVAVHLGDTGNITLSSRLWKVTENIPETPSVLVHKDLVYMAKNGGTATCVNAQTGEVIYSEKLNATGSYLASPLLANGFIYFSSYNGKITIIKEGPFFEIVSQVDLQEKIGASPVALKDKLYIRTDEYLYAFQNTPIQN
jgi:outer membrane protein assembly factor BamB